MATGSGAITGDWLDDPRTRRWAFTAPQVAFLVGFLLPVNWRAVVWPAALLVIGTACVANARRCGRVHCYFSGPFFLAAAVLVVGYHLQLFGGVPGGWDGLGLGIVVVATVLNVVPERLWGRYRGVSTPVD